VKEATERRLEFVSSAPAPRWARVVATFCGIGYLRPGPGTWASAATVALWSLFAHLISSGIRAPAAMMAAALAAAIGIPAGTRVARASGEEDPSVVVIDEVAGQMIALVGAPLSWKSLLASLILFRAFDIMKPPPLRRLERIPEGTGIMLDDVGAGLYALIVMQLLLRFGYL
jgi:phosphatidylglycerophosphatase A